jgi:polar amino acid transport system substrate-binding protein
MKRFWILMPLVLSSFVPLVAQDKILVVTPGYEHPMARIAAKILPEAYKEIGYAVEIQALPQERALRALDEGSADAYSFADDDFFTQHKGTVKVREQIGSDDIVVFTKYRDFKVKSWDSLKPYMIGYQIGMAIVERNIVGFYREPSQNPPQVFQKLSADRSDVAVMPLGVGLVMMEMLNLTDISIIEPPLERVPLYHALGSKYAFLAPKLAAALSRMNKSGRIKAVTDEVYASFLK